MNRPVVRVLMVALVLAALASIPTYGKAEETDPFVDRVVNFTPGNPASEQFENTEAVLGPPDFNAATLSGWLALGVGGSVTVEFVDNVTINGPGKDLQIFGDPANDEQWIIEVSANGNTFKSFGLVNELTSLDLSDVGLEDARFVRLTDDGSPTDGISIGAELDAIQALNSTASARNEPISSPVPTILVPAPVSVSETSWIRTGGPLGGLGYDIRMRPDNPDLMFVTDAYTGVFSSNDGGLNWAPTNQGITTRTGSSGDAIPVFSLTIDPNNFNTVWIGTQFQRGIFKSTDGGRTWQRLVNGIIENEGITFRGFTIDPTNSDIVYAAAEISSWAWNHGQPRNGREFDMTAGVIYKTTNGGQSWQAVWRGNNLARYIWIDPRNPNVVYISTGFFDREAANSDPQAGSPGGEGILKSSDGGLTWQAMNNGLGNLYVTSLFMHPTNPDILFAATGNIQYRNGGGIYLTFDGAGSWRRVLAGDSDDIFEGVEVSSSNPNIVYAGNDRAIYRSEDGGLTWSRVSGGDYWGPPGVRAGFPVDFQADPRNPDRIFANEYGGGNFLSQDGGRSWVDASRGYTGAQVRDIVVDPSVAGHVIAAARSGIFVSYDGGNIWDGLSFPPAVSMEWNAVAIDPNDSQHVLAATNWNGLLDSNDGGQTWQLVANLPTNRIGWRAISFAPSDPAIVFAGSAGFFSAGLFDPLVAGNGIYISRDGGLSWTEANDALSQDAHVTALSIDPTNPQTVFAATTNHGLLMTKDAGQTWRQVVDLPNGVALSVTINPASPAMVLAGFESRSVFISNDGGMSWKRSASGLNLEASVSDIVIDPFNPLMVIYLTDLHSGVYRSIDGGRTWSLISNGLSIRAINAISLSKDGLHLYAASEGGGVYRLDLNGLPPESAPRPEIKANASTPTVLLSPGASPPGPSRIFPCKGAAIIPLGLVLFAYWNRKAKMWL